jgi:WD40 repeat protein
LEAAPPGLAVWNSKTRQSGRTHKELRHPDDALFSPTGTVLAIFLGQFEGADPAVVLWDVKTEKSRPLTPPRKQFHDAWFSPDGRTLATREARELELWDVASGRRRGILAAKGDPLFSPDSRLILVDCGADRAISAWDCQSGELAWQSDPADRLVFTPDSRFLMSGRDRVGRIDIVEPMVGLRRTRITLARGVDFASRYPPPHYAATFSRDGKLVAIRNNMPGTRQSGALQRWLGNWWSSQSGIYVTVVAELGSGREVFRLETTDLLHSILADDGKTLVTSHYRDGDKESVIHCWDIPAPWRWEVAAIPAGVGLLVLFGIWWRGRRKTH